MTRDGLTRLSVNMNPETARAIRDYMQKHDVTATEAVRRAISLMAFAEGVYAEGRRLLIQMPDRGETSEVILL